MIKGNDMIWEIERHDWSKLRAEGSASQIPHAIRELQAAATEPEALAAYWKIDNTIVVQGQVYQAALAAVPCLLGVLLRCTDAARRHVLELLVQIGSGEVAACEIELGEADLVQRCLREIARGLPIYVDIIEHTANADECAFCVDLLGLSCGADHSLRERILWYFERVRVNASFEGTQRLIRSWMEELNVEFVHSD
ncbi:hypothetical protein WME98_11795 [Sorangium sp. So ce296]|uniref:hypothetical protein n=1 Tax=Sorangium sp. So ce296 TaxID=3133296 RepID=UPI003F623517